MTLKSQRLHRTDTILTLNSPRKSSVLRRNSPLRRARSRKASRRTRSSVSFWGRSMGGGQRKKVTDGSERPMCS